jgi:LCP family protein required for cell wall assembly
VDVSDPGGRPQYKLYRSRRGPLAGLRPPGDLQGLRQRLRRRRGGRTPGDRRGITPGRVLRWLAVFVLGWLAFSLTLFLLSAQVEKGASTPAEQALSGGGSLLTGSTILVLGSDQRIGESIDESQRGPARADTIMLVRVGFGTVRKLSIPRDSFAQIPGRGGQKINAAYAIGGAALMIRTVEGFLGNDIQINHLIEVDFEDFPELIDALGGITVDVDRKICSPPFDNFWKGLTFGEGRQKLDGTRALGFARIRKNTCAPNETDLDRARRQQEVLAGIRHKLVSPTTFLRLPVVSWRAPKTLDTDMKGPGLMALFADLATASSDDTNVVEPSCLSCGPGGSLLVSAGAKQAAVDKLLGN